MATIAEKVEAITDPVEMLHWVWSANIDRGGQTEEEYDQIMNAAEALLARHGVKV